MQFQGLHFVRFSLPQFNKMGHGCTSPDCQLQNELSTSLTLYLCFDYNKLIPLCTQTSRDSNCSASMSQSLLKLKIHIYTYIQKQQLHHLKEKKVNKTWVLPGWRRLKEKKNNTKHKTLIMTKYYLKSTTRKAMNTTCENGDTKSAFQRWILLTTCHERRYVMKQNVIYIYICYVAVMI